MMRLLPLATLLLSFAASAEVRTYDIKGMTCGGCKAMVSKEVCGLPGVKTCNVEIGKVVLDGENLNDDTVKAAVAKAGEYSVTSVEHAAVTGEANKPNPGPTTQTTKKLKK